MNQLSYAQEAVGTIFWNITYICLICDFLIFRLREIGKLPIIDQPFQKWTELSVFSPRGSGAQHHSPDPASSGQLSDTHAQ